MKFFCDLDRLGQLIPCQQLVTLTTIHNKLYFDKHVTTLANIFTTHTLHEAQTEPFGQIIALFIPIQLQSNFAAFHI
jgi:hypothetical protein